MHPLRFAKGAGVSGTVSKYGQWKKADQIQKCSGVLTGEEDEKERQKGSITVEATLFIPIFLFAFMSIYSLVSFARAQLLIQYAADQAAREVAQYSYILEKQVF